MGADVWKCKDKCTVTKFCVWKILKPRLLAVCWLHASNMLSVKNTNKLDYCVYLTMLSCQMLHWPFFRLWSCIYIYTWKEIYTIILFIYICIFTNMHIHNEYIKVFVWPKEKLYNNVFMRVCVFLLVFTCLNLYNSSNYYECKLA